MALTLLLPCCRAADGAIGSLPEEAVSLLLPLYGDLGLSLNRDGSLWLDTDSLQRTLTVDPRGDPGSLAGSETRYSAQIARNQAALDKIAEQQEQLRERMTREFVAADRRVASSNSTLSFLRAQVDLWTARSQ